MAASNFKFKEPGVTIRINGQRINQGNLTQEDYDYLISWNPNYADLFEPADGTAAVKPDQPKPKNKKDGNVSTE